MLQKLIAPSIKMRVMPSHALILGALADVNKGSITSKCNYMSLPTQKQDTVYWNQRTYIRESALRMAADHEVF